MAFRHSVIVVRLYLSIDNANLAKNKENSKSESSKTVRIVNLTLYLFFFVLLLVNLTVL